MSPHDVVKLVDFGLTHELHAVDGVQLTLSTLPRGDENRLHLSDAVACNRAVWYRRHGQLEPKTPRSILTMQRGKALEAVARAAIAQAFVNHVDGAKVYHESSALGEMKIEQDGSGYANLIPRNIGVSMNADTAIGHLDLLVRWTARDAATWLRVGVLVEIKSTAFLKGDFPVARYATQVEAYADALMGTEEFDLVYPVLVEISAVTGEHKIHMISLETTSQARARLAQMRDENDQAEPPVGMVPVEWFAERGRGKDKKLVNLLCSQYCGYTQCPQHEARSVSNGDD